MLPRFDLMQDLGPFDDHNSDRDDRLGCQEPASKAGLFTIVRTCREAVMRGCIGCVRRVAVMNVPPGRMVRIARRTSGV